MQSSEINIPIQCVMRLRYNYLRRRYNIVLMKYIIYLQTPPTLRDPADFKFVGGQNYNVRRWCLLTYIFIETELNIKKHQIPSL